MFTQQNRVSPKSEAELGDEDAPLQQSDGTAVVDGGAQGAQGAAKQPASSTKVEEEEDIVDYYLRTTHWTRQTIISAHLAMRSVWKLNVAVRGVEATKDALKSFWTTLGVVSALLISVSYTSAVTPLTTDDPAKQDAAWFVTVVGGISLMISLLVIVMTVIYLIEIDNCTTEKDLRDFIRNNGSLFDILTGFFSASVVLLATMALATMYVTYTRAQFLIVVVTAGVFALAMAAFAAVIAGHNRFRLWARYESPKAVEKKAAAKKQ
ncbi:hypothetical protein HYH03_011977 [Edaphochlamys debaryana]|uniref:Uncharacterized protein n=1 Tax=Edaphochlamys debaryana TaxID=47281 RepID=A0A835XSY4_9CHLO|nr:hypothetical protein HYH03_011977 [Edaphochlamys debaryana]|eukprot:KAG2489526.1 hypothetical protein HYH03_011977 [Edaphochlamys debaryana]